MPRRYGAGLRSVIWPGDPETLHVGLAPIYRDAWLRAVYEGRPVVPIVTSLMSSLVKQYGEKRGHDVYYAMEAEGKGPFAKGGKYHHLHRTFAEKHDVAPIEGKKKPRPKKGRGSRR